MKKIIITMAVIASSYACKKSTDIKTEAPVKYYFRIEAVDTDGTQSTITAYKIITVD